jgi:hypothetical protein
MDPALEKSPAPALSDRKNVDHPDTCKEHDTHRTKRADHGRQAEIFAERRPGDLAQKHCRNSDIEHYQVGLPGELGIDDIFALEHESKQDDAENGQNRVEKNI